eukprot:1187625-Amphidinium_carterae.1
MAAMKCGEPQSAMGLALCATANYVSLPRISIETAALVTAPGYTYDIFRECVRVLGRTALVPSALCPLLISTSLLVKMLRHCWSVTCTCSPQELARAHALKRSTVHRKRVPNRQHGTDANNR